MSTPKSVLELAKKSGAKMVDVKFVDTFGTWQHFSCPIGELTEDVFAEGFGFDGSSIRGWKSIEASDMLAMPDPASAFIDPFCAVPTLSLTCTIAETGTKEAYSRDPRGIAQRAEKYLRSTGVADSAVFGPEAEFFIFDNVQFDSKSNGTFYQVDSGEAIWNTGREELPNLGYKIRHKEGYFPVAPWDTQQDIRTEMCLVMEKLGIQIERQHHEVATAGQAEIDFRLPGRGPFVVLALDLDAQLFHHQAHLGADVLLGVQRRHGKIAFLVPDFVAQIGHLVPPGVPNPFLRINRVERAVALGVELDAVEDEKLRFRTEHRAVGDAGGLEVFFGPLRDAAGVAGVGFFGPGLGDGAGQREGGLGHERVDEGGGRIGHGQHVGGFDRF